MTITQAVNVKALRLLRDLQQAAEKDGLLTAERLKEQEKRLLLEFGGMWTCRQTLFDSFAPVFGQMNHSYLFQTAKGELGCTNMQQGGRLPAPCRFQLNAIDVRGYGLHPDALEGLILKLHICDRRVYEGSLVNRAEFNEEPFILDYETSFVVEVYGFIPEAPVQVYFGENTSKARTEIKRTFGERLQLTSSQECVSGRYRIEQRKARVFVDLIGAMDFGIQ